MENKPKSSFKDLYTKMLSKGITFTDFSDADVIDLLSNKNYYYRVYAYRKNFKKNSLDKYIGLDFTALVDLSSIDTYLREYLLHLCLDIEHIVKTKLMAHITENVAEDGYNLVKQFEEKNKDLFDKIYKQFEYNLYKKRYVW